MMSQSPLSKSVTSQELHSLRNDRKNNMKRFATLLGTYSLNDVPVISLRHTQPNDKEAEFTQQQGQLENLLIASSCNALRGMMSKQNEAFSSFPGLLLNSFGGRQIAPDMAQKKQIASVYVGRPIVFLPPHRVDIESSVESDTNQEFRSHNKYINNDDIATFRSKRQGGHHESKIHLKDDDVSSAIHKVEDIARVPCLMMSNFSSSFALLVEARLRAFGNILKRHIATFSQDTSLDQRDEHDVDKSMLSHNGCPVTTQLKLDTLVAIGEHMKINGVVTTFNVLECTPISFPQSWGEVNDVDEHFLTLPITFKATVDIAIPEHNHNEWHNNTVTLSMQTSGTITGCYEEGSFSSFTQVHVHLDTNELVSQMINKARYVATKAIHNANAAISELNGTQSEEQQDTQIDSQPVAEANLSFSSKVPDVKMDIPAQMVTPEITPSKSKMMPCAFTLDGENLESLIKDGTDKDCAAIIDYAIGNFSS